MPYILLVLGILVGLYGLYRFFLTATVRQVLALALAIGLIVMATALFFLAVTGRLPAAIGLLALLVPLALNMRRRLRQPPPGSQSPPHAATAAMSREEALAVLGLAEGATDEDIKAAHKKLIKKTHPDAEGSEWLAARINQARDVLLRQ